ncbi:MAG: ParB-like nuclease domain-containing protein [Deltaproteobacteria bacterium]|nr:ParB-like nuclease domain-containing protein [Deltaproteobacteria bacterium]
MSDLMSQTKLVSIADADIAEEIPFTLSWGGNLEPLKNSLARVGQITPLVLWPDQNEIKLLCGARRRRVLRELGRNKYSSWLLPQGIRPEEAMLLAIEENLGHRQFNETEKALVIKSLCRYIPIAEVASNYLPKLDIPPKDTFLNRYLSLNKLAPTGLEALAGGRLDPETGEFLAGLSLPDQEAILSLLNVLNPNFNQRRQLITWLEEISHREDRTMAEVLQDHDLQEILTADNLNRSQKEKKIRSVLRSRRYPTLVRLENDRMALLKKLALPAAVHFKLPNNFEGLSFSMEIVFADVAGLRANLQALERAADSPVMSDLLDLG